MEHQELFKLYQSFEGKAAFEQRTKHGRQPILDIAGYPYFVNLRAGMLEPVDFPDVKPIKIDDLRHVDVISSTRFCYYSPAKRKQLPYTNKARFPADAIRVEIAADYILDPIGWARETGKNDTLYYLKDDLVQGNAFTLYDKAQVTPLQTLTLKSKKKKGKKL